MAPLAPPGSATGDASPQKVTQRWILGNVHYIHLHKKVNKAEPTLALKPRGDVTRKPKHGYQWPQKGHVSVKTANAKDEG